MNESPSSSKPRTRDTDRMTQNTPARTRRPYRAPRLTVYGDLATLTLTVSPDGPKNDMFGNFKT